LRHWCAAAITRWPTIDDNTGTRAAQAGDFARTASMIELKLLALDAEDLAVISAHLQDAILLVGDMIYRPSEKRFVALTNRFDWTSAAKGGERSYERHRAALRFDRVLAAQLQGIDLKAKQQVLELLAIQFEETDPPAGIVTLVFAGGAAVRLRVECIEAELRDLGAAWKARRKPEHPDGDPASST
jgi:Protein of unknown function (DUF2948)